MSVLTTIANEFPLLAAIAHELGTAHDGNEQAQLLTARRLLGDAFRTLNQPLEIVNTVPSTRRVVAA